MVRDSGGAAVRLDERHQLRVDGIEGAQAIGPERKSCARLRRQLRSTFVDVGIDPDLAKGVAYGQAGQAATANSGLERACRR